MAKNKGTHGKAKSTVEVEDEFVAGAGKVATALAPHTKRLLIGAVVLLVAASAWAGWDWYQKKQARAHTHDASDALLLAVAPIAQEGEQDPLPDSFPSVDARRATA
ncbi:MAG: hypothetical protein KJO07_22455, partial [Deltaproteobacteria bacterium]|nr:hypothetical protein [Deltaproteobacteria bacterium]